MLNYNFEEASLSPPSEAQTRTPGAQCSRPGVSPPKLKGTPQEEFLKLVAKRKGAVATGIAVTSAVPVTVSPSSSFQEEPEFLTKEAREFAVVKFSDGYDLVESKLFDASRQLAEWQSRIGSISTSTKSTTTDCTTPNDSAKAKRVTEELTRVVAMFEAWLSQLAFTHTSMLKELTDIQNGKWHFQPNAAITTTTMRSTASARRASSGSSSTSSGSSLASFSTTTTATNGRYGLARSLSSVTSDHSLRTPTGALSATGTVFAGANANGTGVASAMATASRQRRRRPPSEWRYMDELMNSCRSIRRRAYLERYPLMFSEHTFFSAEHLPLKEDLPLSALAPMAITFGPADVDPRRALALAKDVDTETDHSLVAAMSREDDNDTVMHKAKSGEDKEDGGGDDMTLNGDVQMSTPSSMTLTTTSVEKKENSSMASISTIDVEMQESSTVTTSTDSCFSSDFSASGSMKTTTKTATSWITTQSERGRDLGVLVMPPLVSSEEVRSRSPLKSMPAVFSPPKVWFDNGKRASGKLKIFRQRQQFLYEDTGIPYTKQSDTSEALFTRRTARDFVIKNELGKGQYGRVYLARTPLRTLATGTGTSKKSQFAVAIKSVYTMIDGDSDVGKHCQSKGRKTRPFSCRMHSEGVALPVIREIAALKALNHKNILKLYDVVIDQKDFEKFHLILEFVNYDLEKIIEGCYRLAKLPAPLKREVRVPRLVPDARHWFRCAEVKSIMFGILNGLQYLESQGYLHRDLKPANVLVSLSGDVKLADFGLSRFAAHINIGPKNARKPTTQLTNGHNVVTRWYRAPEICIGEAVFYDHKVDTWAAGCILMELIIGSVLFDSECKDENRHLDKIVDYLGFPTKEVFPDLYDDSQPFYAAHLARLRRKQGAKKRIVERLMAEKLNKLKWSPESIKLCMSLTRKLLVYDPRKRATALEAMEHKFFAVAPLPTAIRSDLMTRIDDVTSKHRRDKKEREKALQRESERQLLLRRQQQQVAASDSGDHRRHSFGGDGQRHPSQQHFGRGSVGARGGHSRSRGGHSRYGGAPMGRRSSIGGGSHNGFRQMRPEKRKLNGVTSASQFDLHRRDRPRQPQPPYGGHGYGAQPPSRTSAPTGRKRSSYMSSKRGSSRPMAGQMQGPAHGGYRHGHCHGAAVSGSLAHGYGHGRGRGFGYRGGTGERGQQHGGGSSRRGPHQLPRHSHQRR